MDDLPPPVKVYSENTNKDQKSSDDSLIEAGFKVKNPLHNFFEWIKNFLKRNQNITIKIPIIGILVALTSFSAGVGSGYHWGFNAAISTFFPNSSPILHRAISVEGIIQKSSTKYYLKAQDNTVWSLKNLNSSLNLTDYLNQQVVVKGNLTTEKLVIEVAEVIPVETFTSPSIPNTTLNADIKLPALYSGLHWETSQRKTLIFTSGKRKIEQEGVYFESSQVSGFPQDFINYYLQSLKSSNFKETLNSISPEGITITYAQEDLFLTFGVKNKYSGSGDKKQLSGYTAFIEHN